MTGEVSKANELNIDRDIEKKFIKSYSNGSAECVLCGKNIELGMYSEIGAKHTLLKHLIDEHPNVGIRIEKKLFTDESKANEEYSDPECMLCGRFMHNSFEQNDDKESIRNAITRHYEEYHPMQDQQQMDIELKKQLAKTGRDMGGGSNSQESKANENVASKLAYYYQKDAPNDWNDNQVSNEAEKILEETYGIKPKKEVVKVEAKESLSTIQQKIVDRKLDGVRNESIIHELKLWDEMSEEQATKAVETTEIPLQDSIAYTLFSKKYAECNENEIQELKIYAGESRVNEGTLGNKTPYPDPECKICGRVMINVWGDTRDEGDWSRIENAIKSHYQEAHYDDETVRELINNDIQSQHEIFWGESKAKEYSDVEEDMDLREEQQVGSPEDDEEPIDDNVGESKASPEYLHQQRRRLLAKAEEDRVCPVCGEKSPYVRMGDFWETHFADKHRLNESKAKEYERQDYGIGTPAGDIIWKHFNEVHSMDQDDVFCNHCGEQMTEPVRKALISGQDETQVYFDHLANNHNISYESKKVNKRRGGVY